MPGFGIGLPPEFCRTGSKLRAVPGSVCSRCYAFNRGNYGFPRVKRAQRRRFDIITRVLESGRGSERWREYVTAFETLLRREAYFRVHDSGDLQSFNHLILWCDIARAVPGCMFWIPTKEIGIIRRARPESLDHKMRRLAATVPPNVTIRYSAPMINTLTEAWHPNSVTMTRDEINRRGGSECFEVTGALVCPASLQGNACRDCRACWNPTVETVVYPKH